MFGKKEVSVEVGDCFVEPLAGKKRIFRALGIAEKASAEAFVSTWEVTEITQFNNLPHARIVNNDSGITRTISVDTLARQENYLKQKL